MLKNNANNKQALTIKRILDGNLKCDTYNLRICFYQGAKAEYNNLKICLQELEQKVKQKDLSDFFKECVEEFNEKISIYEQYFKLLKRRESEGLTMIEIKRVNTTAELCPICENEVVIPADYPSNCPECNNTILPCSMCNMDQVDCRKCKFDIREV